MKCSLAVDIGASNGRIVAGYLENGRLLITEIHRFDNHLIKKQNHLCWDIDKLFSEIKKGIVLSKEKGFKAESIGIDTWAVDFVLLDTNNQLLTDAVAYRDPRTSGMMEEVFITISKEDLYKETGIQFQKFNTIYQLYYIKKNNPQLLENAKSFLMIPDYLNYLLTGKKVNEYTNATTTQLVNASTKNWDMNLIDQLGINKDMFKKILPPKSIVGTLTKELVTEFGFDLKVILPPTHDTASAVVSLPVLEDTIFISSGTWSLIGVENMLPICTKKALNYNFTNEGGLDYRYRFLKNIMGLWMIQEVKRNYLNQYSFADLAAFANQEINYSSKVNVDDDRFLKPENMILEIQKYCSETNQQIPQTPGQIARCVFDSLAASYQSAILGIEEIQKKTYKQINVIGGGSQNKLLNQLIADTTNKEVIAGPVEASAIGNIITQLLALHEINGLEEARSIIKDSFEIKKYRSRKKAEEFQ